MNVRLALALAAAFCFLVAPATARSEGEEAPEGPTDAEGCKDHRAVPRYPGQVIVECDAKEFDAAEMPLAAEGCGADKVERLEGKMSLVRYQNPEKVSALQIARNYERALKASGYQLLLRTRSNCNDGFEWVTARLRQKGSETWVSIRSEQGADTELRVVEVQALEQKVEIDAAGMLAEIERTGHVAVYGILFDTGKFTIRPDSEPVLRQIVTLLQDNPALKLRVEGHTDDVGTPAANLKLSKERAASVKAWLVKAGIAGARLAAEGYGATRPIAGNDGDEGRAKNRRVELVKI